MRRSLGFGRQAGIGGSGAVGVAGFIVYRFFGIGCSGEFLCIEVDRDRLVGALRMAWRVSRYHEVLFILHCNETRQ